MTIGELLTQIWNSSVVELLVFLIFFIFVMGILLTIIEKIGGKP